MSNLLLAIVCLLAGKLLQNVKQFPDTSAQVLNAYVIYLALPALILLHISKVSINSEVMAPVLGAWAVMGFSAGLTWLLAKHFKWSAPKTGALLLVITLGNTSFIGLPLIEAYLGSSALPYAILYDQLGTFLALNTLGIAIASHYSADPHAQTQALWQKIIKFPPFGALLCGFLLGSVEIPIYLSDVLQSIANTLVPVVMVAVGLQWRLKIEADESKVIIFAIAFMLLLKPLFALGFVSILNLKTIVGQTIILEAGMPAMISTSVLAITYNLAPRMVATIIGYSLMLSFLTVWLWSLVI